MNYLLTIVGLMYFVFVSCNQEIYISPADRIEWCVGECLFEFDTAIMANQYRLIIQMETNSLCPNSGIGITLSSESKKLFDSLITNFPFRTEIIIPMYSKITIHSKVKTIPNSVIVCKRLGYANCKIEI